MRLQTRHIAETMEKLQEEKNVVKKRRRVVIKKACKYDLATWQFNANKRAKAGSYTIIKKLQHGGHITGQG